MKLNWAERLVVNNPIRVLLQRWHMGRFRRMAPFKAGATILEVGCGRGAGAKLIWEGSDVSLLCASDLDMKMIQSAYGYLSENRSERIFLHVADALHLPFKDATLDAVFGFGVLHHIPDWRSAILEIARILKPGGIYYIEELYPSLYQNVITKRILLHPTEDRFLSDDLRTALEAIRLPIQRSIECKKLGILGTAIKGR